MFDYLVFFLILFIIWKRVHSKNSDSSLSLSQKYHFKEYTTQIQHLIQQIQFCIYKWTHLISQSSVGKSTPIENLIHSIHTSTKWISNPDFYSLAFYKESVLNKTSKDEMDYTQNSKEIFTPYEIGISLHSRIQLFYDHLSLDYYPKEWFENETCENQMNKSKDEKDLLSHPIHSEQETENGLYQLNMELNRLVIDLFQIGFQTRLFYSDESSLSSILERMIDLGQIQKEKDNEWYKKWTSALSQHWIVLSSFSFLNAFPFVLDAFHKEYKHAKTVLQIQDLTQEQKNGLIQSEKKLFDQTMCLLQFSTLEWSKIYPSSKCIKNHLLENMDLDCFSQVLINKHYFN